MAEERDHLLSVIENMTPKIELVKCQDLHHIALEEVKRLQKLCISMVPLSDLDSAKDDVQTISMECDRLKKLVQCMVPEPQLLAAQDEISLLRSEIKLLQKTMKEMVPRSSLDKISHDLQVARSIILSIKTQATELRKNCNADIEWLLSAVEHMVPITLLDQKSEEIKALLSEKSRLHSFLISKDRTRFSSPTGSNINGNDQSREGSPKLLSFALPASGLSTGQEGRLTPFMLQVTCLIDVFVC